VLLRPACLSKICVFASGDGHPRQSFFTTTRPFASTYTR